MLLQFLSSIAFLRQEVQAPASAIADFLDILIEDARRLQIDGMLADLERMRTASGRLTSFVTGLVQGSWSDSEAL